MKMTKILRELFKRFGGPNEVFFYVVSLKEEGNSLYKLNDFSNAFVIYKKSIKSLCVAMSAVCDNFSDCENNSWFKDIIISLTLNLAACALKLEDLKEVVVLCSLTLEANSRNSKVLFRRGIAFVKLGNFGKAYDDLKRAKNLEPKNKDIVKELTNLEKVMLENCKNQEVKKEKNIDIDGMVGGDSGQVPKSLDEKQLSSKPDERKMKKQVGHTPDLRAGNDGKIAKNCEVKEETGKDPTSKKEGSMEEDRLKSPNLECLSRHSLKNGKVTFVNKRRPYMQLKISREDVDKLKQGKSIQSFHPNSMSILKVRTFTPKPDIMMETPENCVLREAAVSKVNFSKDGKPEITPSKKPKTMEEKDNSKINNSSNPARVNEDTNLVSRYAEHNQVCSQVGQGEVKKEVEKIDVTEINSKEFFQVQEREEPLKVAIGQFITKQSFRRSQTRTSRGNSGLKNKCMKSCNSTRFHAGMKRKSEVPPLSVSSIPKKRLSHVSSCVHPCIFHCQSLVSCSVHSCTVHCRSLIKGTHDLAMLVGEGT